MERKNLKFDLKEINDAGEFKGYASTRKKDMYEEIVSEGAFTHTINMSEGRVPILWFHGPRDPIGITTNLAEDGHGLYMEGTLDLDIESGRRVRSGMRKGYIDRMSIGFRTVKDEWDSDAKARVLKEVELLEISPVTRHFAANDEALITGVKSSDISALVAELRDLTAVLKTPHPADASGSDGDPPPAADPAYASLRARIEELKTLAEGETSWN